MYILYILSIVSLQMSIASQVRKFQFDKGAYLTPLASVRLWYLEVSKSVDTYVFATRTFYTNSAVEYHNNGTINSATSIPIQHSHHISTGIHLQCASTSDASQKLSD
jgi:hypothetical protein